MRQDLKGRRALVVGGSAGIGRETGLHLAKLGIEVAFHGRRAEKLEEAVAAAGSGCAIVADLTDADSCAELVERAAAQLGGLDAIVHAASASHLGLVSEMTGKQWMELYMANVVAPALVIRAALPHLSEGAICAFLSSESVGMPYQGLIPYGSSKAALEEVVRGLRLEHPEFRFACIRVGQTMGTDFARDFDVDLATKLYPKWVAHGRISARAMDVVEVGRMIAESIGNALLAPSVEMQELVLRAPGGLLSSDPTVDMEHWTES